MMNSRLLDMIRSKLNNRAQVREGRTGLNTISESSINKKLDKEKEVNFRPTSSREIRRNPVSEMFQNGITSIWNGTMLNTNNEQIDEDTRVVQVPSTAISHIRYDPKNELLYQTFVNGNKEYVYKVSKSEFRKYMNSGSKGRYTNRVLKYKNRAPKRYWS